MTHRAPLLLRVCVHTGSRCRLNPACDATRGTIFFKWVHIYLTVHFESLNTSFERTSNFCENLSPHDDTLVTTSYDYIMEDIIC